MRNDVFATAAKAAASVAAAPAHELESEAEFTICQGIDEEIN